MIRGLLERAYEEAFDIGEPSSSPMPSLEVLGILSDYLWEIGKERWVDAVKWMIKNRRRPRRASGLSWWWRIVEKSGYRPENGLPAWFNWDTSGHLERGQNVVELTLRFFKHWEQEADHLEV